jgi:transposase-like protein
MDGGQTNNEVDPVRESLVRRRRKWSVREKTRIVQEAQRAGAVLQEVAWRNGLHPSLLTRRRVQHQAEAKKAPRREARLLAVRRERRVRSRARAPQPSHRSGSPAKLVAIEVESTGWRVLRHDATVPHVCRLDTTVAERAGVLCHQRE